MPDENRTVKIDLVVNGIQNVSQQLKDLKEQVKGITKGDTNTNTTVFKTYQSQIKDLTNEAQKFHQEWKSGNKSLDSYTNEFNRINSQIKTLRVSQEEFNSSIVRSESYLGSFAQKFRKVSAA